MPEREREGRKREKEKEGVTEKVQRKLTDRTALQGSNKVTR